jgi:hypothetical protein
MIRNRSLQIIEIIEGFKLGSLGVSKTPKVTSVNEPQPEPQAQQPSGLEPEDGVFDFSPDPKNQRISWSEKVTGVFRPLLKPKDRNTNGYLVFALWSDPSRKEINKLTPAISINLVANRKQRRVGWFYLKTPILMTKQEFDQWLGMHFSGIKQVGAKALNFPHNWVRNRW